MSPTSAEQTLHATASRELTDLRQVLDRLALDLAPPPGVLADPDLRQRAQEILDRVLHEYCLDLPLNYGAISDPMERWERHYDHARRVRLPDRERILKAFGATPPQLAAWFADGSISRKALRFFLLHYWEHTGARPVDWGVEPLVRLFRTADCLNGELGVTAPTGPLVLYRGCEAEYPTGIHWTTSPYYAEMYAIGSRAEFNRPIVQRAVVEPDRVLWIYNQSHLLSVMIDPVGLDVTTWCDPLTEIGPYSAAFVELINEVCDQHSHQTTWVYRFLSARIGRAWADAIFQALALRLPDSLEDHIVARAIDRRRRELGWDDKEVVIEWPAEIEVPTQPGGEQ